MTNELRQIIADLSEGRCVPSMQKRAAEALLVAERAIAELRKLQQAQPWEIEFEPIDAVLADAADLFFYADEEAANADAS